MVNKSRKIQLTRAKADQEREEAGEMAQLIRHLPHKHENRSSGVYHPYKCQVDMVACL